MLIQFQQRTRKMTNNLRVVELYADGACSGNPGPGGWACILRDTATGHESEFSGFCADTTNNRMEIASVIEGFSRLKYQCFVKVYSDSKYVIDTVTKNWQKKKNIDLWNVLDNVIANHRVSWNWVKGHASNKYNDRCDELAVEQYKKNMKGEVK